MNKNQGIELLKLIGYYYVSFAYFSDSEYKLEENEVIERKLLELADMISIPFEKNESIKIVSRAVTQLIKDIEKGESDYIASKLSNITDLLKEGLPNFFHKIMFMQLLDLANADNEVSDGENQWLLRFVDKFDIDIDSLTNEGEDEDSEDEDLDLEVEDDEEPEEYEEDDENDYDYPSIVITMPEDASEEEKKNRINYVSNWVEKTRTYCRRMGIKARIPQFANDMTNICPRFTKKQIKQINDYIIQLKVIPNLSYLPKELSLFSKQIWWLVPFVIWKEEIASWVIIDKDGFYAPYQDDEDCQFIFSWESIVDLDYDCVEDNLYQLTLETEGGILTFSEFCKKRNGSYLSVIESIYSVFKPVIDASRGESIWHHGAGGEGYQTFDSPKDLLKSDRWENPFYYGRSADSQNSQIAENGDNGEKLSKLLKENPADWTTEQINEIISIKGYGKGSKAGDHLILTIAYHPKLDPSWMEDFALSGHHPVEVVTVIVQNESCGEWLLEELYQRKNNKDWRVIDELILSHNNCPSSLKKRVKKIESDKQDNDNFKIMVIPYQRYKTKTIGQPADFYDESFSRKIVDIVQEILKVESPIHIKELSLRTIQHFGMKKVGSKIVDIMELIVKKLNRAKKLKYKDGFVYMVGQTCNYIRKRDILSDIINIETIPFDEIRNAILLVLNKNKRISREDLLLQVARVLGFQHTGQKIKKNINKQISHLLRNKAIESSGEGIVSIS